MVTVAVQGKNYRQPKACWICVHCENICGTTSENLRLGMIRIDAFCKVCDSPTEQKLFPVGN